MVARDFVPETRLGFWFLGTETWRIRVAKRALDDLMRVAGSAPPQGGTVLDVGCGQGLALGLLAERFAPRQLIGIEADPHGLALARARTQNEGIDVQFYHGDVQALPLASNSVDILFCHQTLHHLVHQDDALSEFHRVLKPGGHLLLAESTRAYIYSWIIRALFRHPMEVQRSAEEYLAMLRAHGFEFGDDNVSLPYLWWSRSDLGAKEWFGFGVPTEREETLVNVVARKVG